MKLHPFWWMMRNAPFPCSIESLDEHSIRVENGDANVNKIPSVVCHFGCCHLTKIHFQKKTNKPATPASLLPSPFPPYTHNRSALRSLVNVDDDSNETETVPQSNTKTLNSSFRPETNCPRRSPFSRLHCCCSVNRWPTTTQYIQSAFFSSSRSHKRNIQILW